MSASQCSGKLEMDKVILPHDCSITILMLQYNTVIKTVRVHIITINLVDFFLITG